MSGEFYLDWNNHKLFGWEKEKSEQAVDAIIRGIIAGDKFPPVWVYKIQDNLFSIIGANYVETIEGRIKDGGHTRSKGHIMKNQPLLCNLVSDRPYVMPGYFDPYGAIEITDLNLVDNLESYLEKKRLFPNYR